jgi:hypothetical protein
VTEIRILCSNKGEDGEENGWHKTTVWINGVEQKDLTRVSFDHVPGAHPELNLRW